MINICTSGPIDFSDNAVYVVSHVLHIEQWYPFVTIKLVERAHRVLVLCSQGLQEWCRLCFCFTDKYWQN